MRGIQYAAAYRFNHWRLWNTGSPACAGDDNQVCVYVLATRCARALQIHSPYRKRAQGMPGALLHPRSRVQVAQRDAHTSIQVQPRHSGIPCAVALRLIPCSPWRRIPLASIADGLKACRTRLGSTHLRQLDTSHGCQDHTALPYASAPYVLRAVSAHGRSRPANNLSRRRCRVHRIPPHVRDDGQRPSCRDGTAEFVSVIWVCGEAEYFCGHDWTGQITLKLLWKIDYSRKIDFLRRELFAWRQDRMLASERIEPGWRTEERRPRTGADANLQCCAA
ncbi:hypothetical protein V1277_005093 [Bradyrhizobium sp. AZCC 1588]